MTRPHPDTIQTHSDVEQTFGDSTPLTGHRLVLALAHEMRTPLQGALLHVSLLRQRLGGRKSRAERRAVRRKKGEGQDDDGGFFRAQIAERCLLRMARLINDVFFAAELLKQTIPVPPTTDQGLLAVLRDLDDEFGGVYETRDVKLDVPETLPRILAERTQLEQVLACLLNNAQLYAKAPAQIGVRARPYLLCPTAEPILPPPIKLPEGLYVHIEVWDKGPGISEAALLRVFEAFYRASEGEAAPRGLGLGLFICQEILRRHNGAIWIESAQQGPNRGTTVHVLWPAASRGMVPGDVSEPSRPRP